MNDKINPTVLLLSFFPLFIIGRVHCSTPEKKGFLMRTKISPICKLEPSTKASIQKLKDEVRQLKQLVLNEAKKTQRAIDQVLTLLKKPNGKNCADLYKEGIKQNGVYEIDPDGKGSFKVLCDMTTSGGGWTVFQRRLDGSVDFYRSWQDYKNGFGNLNGEFWLGLDKIHRITTSTKNELRIDMEDTSGNKRYAQYDFFAVTSEQQKYQLSLGAYAGTAGDSFTAHKGMAFTTKDSDNDKYGGNCATTFKGGWWYAGCHQSNLNGLYHHGSHKSYADGINWYHFKGYHYSLKSTSMKIRPGDSG